MTLLEQAVSIADTTGDIEPAVEARSWLARARLQLGDPAAALAAAAAGRELPYPAGEPAMRLLEGLALLELHRREESVRAFSGALAAADALLALADRNVAALQARALALAGLAAATGDPARATQAGEAFARADAVTSAAGVAADTRRLLDQIACHDQSGILARDPRRTRSVTGRDARFSATRRWPLITLVQPSWHRPTCSPVCMVRSCMIAAARWQ